MQVQLKKAKDLDISDIAIEDDQRLILPSLDSQQMKNPVLKQIKQIQLYDVRLEEQKD